MEIRIEIKYPGKGLGTLKPLGPLHSIDSAIGWLTLVEENVIKPAPSPVPLKSCSETRTPTPKVKSDE